MWRATSSTSKCGKCGDIQHLIFILWGRSMRPVPAWVWQLDQCQHSIRPVATEEGRIEAGLQGFWGGLIETVKLILQNLNSNLDSFAEFIALTKNQKQVLVSVRQRQGWEGWMGWSGSSVEFQSIFQMSRSPHRWSCCWGKAGSWPPIGRGRGLKAAARPLIGRWSHRSTGAQSWAYISSVSVASLESCKHCTYTQHRLQIVQILHKHCCEHSPELASVFSSIHIKWTL